MTAVPGDARLTDAERADLCICPLTTKLRPAMEGDTHVYGCRLYAKRVLAILRDRLPEAITVTEWGVRSELSTGEHTGRPWTTRVAAEQSAERLRGIWRHSPDNIAGATTPPAFDSIRIVRRTVTRYADHYGPWEEA